MYCKLNTFKAKKFIKNIIFKLLEFELLFHKQNIDEDKRLLLVKIDAIGDFIIFSPMLKNYKKLYPDYKITLVVNKLNKELAERINFVDEILTFDRAKFRKNPFLIRNLFLAIHRKNFKIAISPTFSREIIGDYLIKISKANKKIGIDGDLCNISKKDKIITDKYFTNLFKIDKKIISELEKNEYFINLLGADVKNDFPIITPSEKDDINANKLLAKNGLKEPFNYIVIFPGSGGPGKAWPIDKYSKIIDWLIREKKIDIVVCGTKNEKKLADKIKTKLKQDITDLTGKTTLPVFASILKKSKLYVGNDTGAVHLAAAVGVSTVCIIGGWHHKRFFPYGDLNKNRIVFKEMSCFNCDFRCKYNRIKCLEDISVEQVKETINKLI